MAHFAATQKRSNAVIKVMIVDDSAVVRGLTKRWLDAEPDIEIVAACADALKAIADLSKVKPDVIILDVEMPHMDGLTAIPQLKRLAPHARIVMASTLTHEGASTTLRAMSAGAADYIAKPEASGLGGASAYQKDLVGKVRALGGAAQVSANPARRTPMSRIPQRPARKSGLFRPKAMVIASSTGGPQALQGLLPSIAKDIRAPIFIVQHMPATFTKILAEKLASLTGKPCYEPRNGEAVKDGCIYLAPGDFHMQVTKSPTGKSIKLDQGPPVNFCRPAADPLFQSAVNVYGGDVLGVVLTGMGSDGKDGAGAIQDAGGRVIVQDEASSVVWGMPGAVATAGHADAVKPLKELPQLALSYMSGRG